MSVRGEEQHLWGQREGGEQKVSHFSEGRAERCAPHSSAIANANRRRAVKNANRRRAVKNANRRRAVNRGGEVKRPRQMVCETLQEHKHEKRSVG